MGNPKVLNLDELELPDSDITIMHEGTAHKMRVLSVDMFIQQQRRAQEHQEMVVKGINSDEGGLARTVELMKEGILEFFPSLPVGELETAKLFRIFAFLNEAASKLNEDGADGEESAEGNVLSSEVQEEA